MDARTLGTPELDELLTSLDVDQVDRAKVVEWASQLDADDQARIDLLVERLVENWDARLAGREFEVFEACDEQHRLGTGVLPVLALALAAPALAAKDLELGYPEQVVRATQADLGQQMRKYRAVHGQTGLDTQWWLVVVLGAGFARLGRLQYELSRSDLGRLDEPVPVLSVHIPGDGPLDPEAVDHSLWQASTFFEEHHEDLGPIDWFTCASWLLDPALVHLVPGSNMADFCSRWQVWKVDENDRDAYYFGFDIEPPKGAELPGDLAELPTDTSLHRAMVEHWRQGEHFMLAHGAIPVIRQVDGV